MSPMDLSLAINYVPAAMCLVRVLFFTLAICLIDPGAEVGGLTVMALVLYIDKTASRAWHQYSIFDSNAVLACVLLSNVLITIRASVTANRMSFIGVMVNLWWGTAAIFMLVEPPWVTRTFERRHRIVYQMVPAVVTVLAVGFVAGVHSDREPAGLRLARAMGFASLSIAWVYIVGTKKGQTPEALRESATSNFVARFSPVLCAEPAVAGLFAAAATGCLGYQCYQLYGAQPPPEPPPKPPQVDDDDLEAFRAARVACGKI